MNKIDYKKEEEKDNFVDTYLEELTEYYDKEFGGEFRDSEELYKECDSWIRHATLEELKEVILGDLTETDDPDFPYLGTQEQFNNSKIN